MTRILGIELILLPLRKQLPFLITVGYFFVAVLLGVISLTLCLSLLFTPLRWLSVLYLLWIYFDRKTCETGGRPNKWMQNWSFLHYIKEYFSTRLILAPNMKLNQKKNYLFCCFPHGVFPAGPFTAFATNQSDFHKLYPQFEVKSVTLPIQFFFPFSREFILGMGAISSSEKSLHYVLNKAGGYILTLHVGGASEAMISSNEQITCVVKNRKGFVRIALKNGCHLVPVITFGETNVYDQIRHPNMEKFQKFVKRYFRFSPVPVMGRGFSQGSLGVFPRQIPLMTVVGVPIEVNKYENPTNDQVDDLHQTFIGELVNLFEEYKYEYWEHAEDKHLIVV